jgi:hypothetical protein
MEYAVHDAKNQIQMELPLLLHQQQPQSNTRAQLLKQKNILHCLIRLPAAKILSQ